MFGFSESEVLGENISALMPSPDRELHDSYLERYLETGVRKMIGIGRITTARHRDGSTFPIDLHVGEARIGEERGEIAKREPAIGIDEAADQLGADNGGQPDGPRLATRNLRLERRVGACEKIDAAIGIEEIQESGHLGLRPRRCHSRGISS